MTEEDMQRIRDTTPDRAAEDFIGFLEDIILQSPLSEEHREKIKIKSEYWFMLGLNRGYITCRDQLIEMSRRTLETDTEAPPE